MKQLRIPLIATKLNIPRPRSTLVPRHHLFEMLDLNLHPCAGFDRKLTLISAPAGYGKTTLLSDWIRKKGLAVGWISLDEHDNDIFRFLMYLIKAMQNIDASVDESCLDLFYAPQPPAIEVVSTILLNQIELVPGNFIIVLDDYHVIEDPLIHQFIDHLLNYQPPQMHLALISRADPPLHLARLRGRGQITELRMKDLRFTRQEAAQFIDQVIGLQIPEADLANLLARTEGWATGIQMAAMSMQGRQDTSAFIRSFTGSHHFILDYLVEEVLAKQSPSVRNFLLQTAILERLNSSLCDQVTSREDGAEILEYLDRANLFIVPLDDERCWYRYHRLFSELLLVRLENSQPALIPELHNRASQWYQDRGDIFSAVDHALKARNFERAVLLIEEVAEKVLMRTQVATLLRWQDKLPQTLPIPPNLSFVFLWGQMLRGYQFDRILDQLENLGDPESLLPGRKLTLLSFIDLSRANIKAAGEQAHLALENLNTSDSYFRSVALWIWGISQGVNQNLHESQKVLAELLEMSKSQDNIMFTVMTASQMGRVQMHLGSLQKAENIFKEALDIARDRRGFLLPIAGEALIGLGDLYRELNRLDEATDVLLEGIELNQKWRDVTAMEGYLSLARVKQAQGDWHAAQQALDFAMALAIKYDVIDLDDRLVKVGQVRLWLAMGRLDLVEQWAAALDFATPADLEAAGPTDTADFQCKTREAMVLSYFVIQQGRYHQALDWIAWLLNYFEGLGRTDNVVELHLLRARVYHEMGEQGEALEPLTEALKLAAPAGFTRIFLDQGQSIQILLTQARVHALLPAYVDRLLAAFEGPLRIPPPKVQPLLEPLSEREQQILAYLQTSLTTPEIADQLYISVTTVRTHIKNIYGKLNVHKRSEAVDLAVEIGLL